VEIRAKRKENRTLPPKTLPCPFSPSRGPPGAPPGRPRAGAAQPRRPSRGLPSLFPPTCGPAALSFSLRRPIEISPARPSWAPPVAPSCLPLSWAGHPRPTRHDALFFFARPSPSSPSARQPGALACSLRAARSSQARRVDGLAAMHSGGRFFNWRPRISRPRRENRPRPRYVVLIRPENSSARVLNISFFSPDRTAPRLETAPRRSSPDLLRRHPVLVGVSIFLCLLSPPLISLFPAESVFFHNGLRACGELARGGLRSRGLARRPKFTGVARPHLPSCPLAPSVACPQRPARPRRARGILRGLLTAACAARGQPVHGVLAAAARSRARQRPAACLRHPEQRARLARPSLTCNGLRGARPARSRGLFVCDGRAAGVARLGSRLQCGARAVEPSLVSSARRG
jgi:hypothetical protein